jgi:hypothetical protein
VLVEPVDNGRDKARNVRRRAADPDFACGGVAEGFDVLDTLPQLVEGGMAAAENGAPAFGELNTCRVRSSSRTPRVRSSSLIEREMTG